MPEISKRGIELSESPIRNLMPFARAAKMRGNHVYHLNIGQPDIETPIRALERVKNIKNKVVAYGPSEGLPELRSTVASYYDKFNAGVEAEFVYVTTGASEAIQMAFLSTCDRGDQVIIPEPFYANYLGFAHLAGIEIVPITTHLEDSFALPDIADFQKKITPRTRAIFLCNPGNPTGKLYSKNDLIQLAEIVKERDLFLIVDEVYREFCYDTIFTSILSIPGLEKNAIVIDSISKVFSSCGSRIGYLISKNEAFLSSVNKIAQLRLCPPFFGQQMALGCYEENTTYIEQAVAEYRKRRDFLFKALSEIPDIKCYKPDAAFYNMVELPIDDAQDFCKFLLKDFSHNNETVMLSPGNGFYSAQTVVKNQVRIAYILNVDDLKRSIELLQDALVAYAQVKIGHF